MDCIFKRRGSGSSGTSYTATIQVSTAFSGNYYSSASINGVEYKQQDASVQAPSNKEIVIECEALIANMDGGLLMIDLNGVTVAQGTQGNPMISYTFKPTGNLTIHLQTMQSPYSGYPVGYVQITM